MMGKPAAQPAALPARKGAAGFEAHYCAVFTERWPTLKRALLADAPVVVRANGFARAAAVAAEPWASDPLTEVPGCFVQEPGGRVQIERDPDGLLTGYIQDPASVLAARLLDAPAAGRVLDLCAAPGGKSLVLAERFAATGQLVLNDRSPDRKKRLLQVLKDYVPEAIRSRIRVHQHDGRLWGKHQPDAYDAILLDAPCSSEQHVLCDPSALHQWSAKRIQRLSREQLALLRSAVHALRPGGQLVYCTCALAPQENDEIIEELLERDPRVTVRETRLPIGQATRLGWHVLPDSTGFGPLFVARLVKH
jgi:16S rRNA C967 or C1407 C5-methylase (RsmB/RsmF family)